MSSTRHDSIVITEVLAHLHRGWSVIPLRARGKRPLIPWERYQSDYPTPTDIRRWWRKHPDANVGVVTGALSKLVVLDVDPASGGNESLKSLEQGHGKLPKTACVRTGGGGTHFYFQHPGTPVQNSAGKLGRGLDVRGDRGYVVAPPAVHENGTQYVWDDLGPDDIVPAPLPGWLLKLMIEVDTPNDAASDQQRIPEGQRNARLTSLGGAMRCRGLSEEAIAAALLAENKAHCKPPLQAKEVRKIAASVARYEPDPTATAEHLTDLGNAQRLVALHGGELRYCVQWREWLIWDGRRWAEDMTQEVERRAKDTIRGLYINATHIVDDTKRRALVQHATRSEAEARISGMVALARSEPRIPVTPDQLDADPWLLNCLNGTLDLRTGELRPHSREMLITRLAPVDYDAKAKCRTWLAFLDRIFKADADLIAFMQRAIGYALTGSTREQCLFLLYGTGANGKSTLLGTISALMGDYAKTTPTETLLVKHSDGPRNDVARLKGARFVSAVEAEDGRRLAEALIKQLTGGDAIAARFLYGELFEFTPTFKLFLAVNHKPIVRGTDHAIWRRIHLIPFAVTIPPDEQDRDLLDKFRLELPGILRWAVDGCLAWQRDGLGAPAAVTKATEQYRSEMDVFASFLNDKCLIEEGATVPVGELYEAYTEWCEDGGVRFPLTKQAFGLRLQERSFMTKRGRGGTRVWRGLALAEETRRGDA